jgi:predicted ester cyclase
VIFDDAALDQAVEGIVNGIYFNQGHVCCAGSRLLVQESVYEDVIEKLKRRLTTLRVGDPLDKNTDVGAINSKQQLEKIQELVASGEEEGAEIYQPPCRLPEKGYWFVPTVFTNVAQSYRIAQEEIFGPVLSVLTFRTPDEAVEKANNTPYGLSAGVWTEKGSRILSMAQRLRAGVIWANTYNRFDPPRPSAATRSPASAARADCTGSSRTWTSNERRRQQGARPALLRGGLGARQPRRRGRAVRERLRAPRLPGGEPEAGAEGQKQIAAAFRSAFPDLTWEIDFVLADGDLVAGRWTATGTHEASWAGVEPTGRSMRFSGINVFRFADGKVVEIWNHRDDLGLMQQLGAPVYAGAAE